MSQDQGSETETYAQTPAAGESQTLLARTGLPKTNPRDPEGAARHGPKTAHALRAQVARRKRG